MNPMRFQRSAAVLVAVLGLICPAQSETTRRWEQGSFDDFRKGKAENISVRSDGKLMLSPRHAEIFEPPAAFLWTLAEDSNGNIFAGGGPGARLFRIGVDGRKSTFFERDNVEVHAVAIDADDNVYAATSPAGKIYNIDPSGGYEVFFDPGAEYIWDMAFDAGGNLFVATGDQGKIFRVTPDGKGEVYFETGETHVRALLLDNDGNLVVGTDPSALILRVSPGADGASGFVAYQSSKKEVTALALGGDGSIYAAAAGNRQGATPSRPTRTTTTTTRPATATSQSGAPPGSQASRTPQRMPVRSPPPSALLTRLTGGSEVYRILPDGEPRKVWSSAAATVYTLGLDKEDKVLVGTGEQGQLFRVESETLETLVATMPSDQITALLQRSSGAMVVATSNVGKLYELGPKLAESGEFESDVLDAKGFSRWGRLEWDNQLPEGAAISISTRSGNLESPSNNWSGWSDSVDSAEGDQAGSPAARFLQWRAHLSREGDASPLLDAVHVYYLPKNVCPVITHLEATPPNYRFAASKPRGSTARNLVLPPLGQPAVRRVRPGSPSSGPPMTKAKGRVGVRWVAQDKNSDDLVFKVEIRGEGEQNWKLVEEDVDEPRFDWDGTSFADGFYRVRVTASDSPSNPASEALTFSKVSESFAIDNSAPAIRDLGAERDGETIRVRFSAVDSASLLRRAEYSLDGTDWEQVLPSTRLFDSRELSFDFATGSVEGGEHTVAVRVYDRFENLAAAKVVVR
jgi:sugar lactone lactonase YvrE